MKKIVIIGGGPAGMMSAISAKLHHQCEVFLFEKNPTLGRKLLITGNGRCNLMAKVTNQTFLDNVPVNSKFMFSCINEFSANNMFDFFASGVPLKIEGNNKVYPQSDKASSILDFLLEKMRQLKVNVMPNVTINKIDPNQQIIHYNDTMMKFDKLVLACGGITYPQTGSDGSAYQYAQVFGHTIIKPLPVEVPLVSNDNVISSKVLQGLSFNNIIATCFVGKQKVSIQNDLIFTHFGISGPLVSRLSHLIADTLKDHPVKIALDFVPNFSEDDLSTIKLDLPKRLLDYIKDQKLPLSILKAFPLEIIETKGLNFAIITKGGVSVKEINPKTMQSKINPNLSIVGEMLDVSAHSGGFNLMVCWTTGWVAGKYIF